MVVKRMLMIMLIFIIAISSIVIAPAKKADAVIPIAIGIGWGALEIGKALVAITCIGIAAYSTYDMIEDFKGRYTETNLDTELDNVWNEMSQEEKDIWNAQGEVILQNGGTGTITVTPNMRKTIDRVLTANFTIKDENILPLDWVEISERMESVNVGSAIEQGDYLMKFEYPIELGREWYILITSKNDSPPRNVYLESVLKRYDGVYVRYTSNGMFEAKVIGGGTIAGMEPDELLVTYQQNSNIFGTTYTYLEVKSPNYDLAFTQIRYEMMRFKDMVMNLGATNAVVSDWVIPDRNLGTVKDRVDTKRVKDVFIPPGILAENPSQPGTYDVEIGEVGMAQMVNFYNEQLAGTGAITFPDVMTIRPEISESEFDHTKLSSLVTTKFPFSLPWDFAHLLGLIAADPLRPEWEVNETFMGLPFQFSINLEWLDDWIGYFRTFILIGFGGFLIFNTRKLLGGGE